MQLKLTFSKLDVNIDYKLLKCQNSNDDYNNWMKNKKIVRPCTRQVKEKSAEEDKEDL